VTDVSLFFSKNSERKTIKIERIRENLDCSYETIATQISYPNYNLFSNLNEFFELHKKGAIAHCAEG
jgi:hypothetical protein